MTILSYTPLLFPLLLALLQPIGYWITTRVPDELPVAAKWITLVQAVLALALFAFFPWWQAAILAGALVIGWLAALIALAVIASGSPFTMELALISVSLALFTGARWRLDEHSPWTLALGAPVLTAVFIGLRSLLG